jgi:16S rRNA (uracil1498-N3)-methyltransferase
VVERRDDAVITLFWDGGPLVAGTDARLGAEPAHHARVRRAAPGDPIRLLDGAGMVAQGTVTSLAKDEISVAVENVVMIAAPTILEVLVPVADRDRMLLAAEKCAELQVTAWRPVFFARSRSVSPRGEGPKFREKVRARMQAALEQSGGAWLPAIADDADAATALRDTSPHLSRFLLDADGEPLIVGVASVPTAIAVGPEGGFERAERDLARESGWRIASLGSTTLRFETAVIAAAAVIRATQLTQRSS